jgi:murein L,D-transpeptidase YcbB/YkuD
MRGHILALILLCAVGAYALDAASLVRAEDQPAPAAQSQPAPASEPSAAAAPAPQPSAEVPSTAPAAAEPQQPETVQAPAPVDPVVAGIRSKLADSAIRKDADAADLAALEAFYAERSSPLWVTEMGFSARAQAALFEVGEAEDWGLDPASFGLPPADALPRTPEEQAIAEIKLDLAILKYARFARGGRLNPPEVSELFDQAPSLRDPKSVLAEIESAEAPDAYLQTLHPKHEQFQRLRKALLAARGKGGEGTALEEAAKPAEDAKKAEAAKKAAAKKPGDKERDIKRLVINMERWRWMPEDLGTVYVWNNSPEFMLYVMKDGKPIYADKTLVGTLNYATPVFTADMKTIVFNPDWIAPETVVKENVWPHLREGNYSILRVHKLQVSYNGSRIDPQRVDWNRVNPLSYTFLQKAGPGNNLGKIKFLYPNRHTVYMHDTLPVRKKYFKTASRVVGHECVRMEKPQTFAEVLLAEDKGWSAAQVKELWDKGNNSAVTIERSIPVHMVYFTSVADDNGKVSSFADVYGLDRKLAAALFGNANGFPPPPPDASKPPPSVTGVSRRSSSSSRTASGSGIANSIGGFIGD